MKIKTNRKAEIPMALIFALIILILIGIIILGEIQDYNFKSECCKDRGGVYTYSYSKCLMESGDFYEAYGIEIRKTINKSMECILIKG